MNYLVTPVLYPGSSFVDIYEGLLKAGLKLGIELETLPVKFGEPNAIGLDNPKEYATDCLRTNGLLLEILKDNDRLLLLDAFFPGLDILEYALSGSNIRVEKFGLLHGSAFIPSDIYAGQTWLKPFETGWYGLIDRLICPSNYFGNFLPGDLQKKLLVSPWGLEDGIVPVFSDKEIDVVFPHRFASDKGTDDLLEIIQGMPDINFCMTGIAAEEEYKSSPELYSRLLEFKEQRNVLFYDMQPIEEHVKTLKRSKVVLSTARQEGFGYAVFKAVQYGCVPVLPNRCCYPEFFPDEYLYSDISEAISMIYNRLTYYPEGYSQVKSTDFSFDPIINLLR